MRRVALSASAMWYGQVGSSRHSNTWRSMINASGSSPSRCPLLDRAGVDDQGAGSDLGCQVGWLQAIEAGARPLKQPIDHRSSWHDLLRQQPRRTMGLTAASIPPLPRGLETRPC
jgi:hypothetical protein